MALAQSDAAVGSVTIKRVGAGIVQATEASPAPPASMLAMKPCCANAPGIGRSVARERDIYHAVIRRVARVAHLRDGWSTAYCLIVLPLTMAVSVPVGA